MKQLIKSDLTIFGTLLNFFLRISPNIAFKLSLKLVSIISKRKLSPEDKVLYSLAYETRVQFEGQTVKGHVWGEGPVILLVHGWRSNAASWRTYIPKLVDLGYQVVAFDAPGHGVNSNLHFDIVKYLKFIELVIAETNNLHTVLGHSIGGTASFFGLLHNQNRSCQKLIMVCPYGSLEGLAIEMANVLKLNKRFVEMFDKWVLENLNEQLDYFRIHDHVNSIKSLELEIIHSADDPIIPISSSIKIRGCSNNVMLLETQNSGHSKSHPEIYKKVMQILSSSIYESKAITQYSKAG